MYSSLGSDDIKIGSGLRRLARRDLPSTPRTPRPVPANDAAEPAAAPRLRWPEITIEAALGWTLQRLGWIAVLAVLGAAGGYAFSVLAMPKYTAYTDLVVDPVNLQVMSNDIYASARDQNSQLLEVESKLRVLTSGNVLTQVVTELGLQNDPEFVPPPNFLTAFLGTSGTTDPVLEAVGTLEKKVSARREERSYVVTVGVSTESPQKSVRIADAVVAAFQTELAKGETEGAARSAMALVDRLSELKASVSAAEDAVQKFRSAHGLEQTAQGESMNVQSMTLLNQRLVEAQQAVISAETRYAELTDPVTGKLNADAIQTPTMVALRTQYGVVKQADDAAATLYGPLHPNRVTSNRQIAGLEAQISAEAARYVQSVKLELDQARSSLALLQEQAQAARTTVGADGEAQVQLRELERDAKAKGDVYEAFLTRAREITERQDLNTTNIRVISPATPPGTRSFPPRGYVVAGLGGAAGVGLGIALALGLGFLGAMRALRKS